MTQAIARIGRIQPLHPVGEIGNAASGRDYHSSGNGDFAAVEMQAKPLSEGFDSLDLGTHYAIAQVPPTHDILTKIAKELRSGQIVGRE
jgi:hypothetical protein